MAEPFLGQISVFGFEFAPVNWQQCKGQIININQSTALFALLGTRFGGNGTTNFGLPNMQGNVAVGQGQLTGGSNYVLGGIGGASSIACARGLVRCCELHTGLYAAMSFRSMPLRCSSVPLNGMA